MSILDEIVRERRRRVERYGHSMGLPLPARRSVPLTLLPPGPEPFIICEVKRSSPSRGAIEQAADAVQQAKRYIESGVTAISVLTEERYFSGSLRDLYEIKTAFRGACIMRKDFILDGEDMDVSYRAGADAVLLIASIHSRAKLLELYRRAKTLGMEVLFEIHDEDDLAKARIIKPEYTGFNSRNLSTFKIDPARPLMLRSMVDWETRCVFESGISSEEIADLALSSGFDGLLIGEAVMKDGSLINRLNSLLQRLSSIVPGSDFSTYQPCRVTGNFPNKTKPLCGPLRSGTNLHATYYRRRRDFWLRLFTKRASTHYSTSGQRPLVKICGITNEDDAHLAVEHGADLLGFVFAPSPRRACPKLLGRLEALDVPKVGVIVLPEEGRALEGDVGTLLEEGLLDAVQFHGDEPPEACYSIAFPYYKAVRIKNSGDVERLNLFHCPRVLVDAFSTAARGGSGHTIPGRYIERVRKERPLWLAGGIGPENVGEIVKRFIPELIDASSRLESEPGRKDRVKISEFFSEIERACLR